MSNRKENLKKALGITEYPWSTDEEESSQPRQITFQQPNDLDVHNEFIYSEKTDSFQRTADSLYHTPHNIEAIMGRRRRRPSSTQIIGHPNSTVNSNRRGPTRMERENYWSMLNNPQSRMLPLPFNINSTKQINGSAVAANFSPPEEMHERCLNSFSVNLNRLQTFRKLSRGLNNSYRHGPVLESSSLIGEPQPSTSRARVSSPLHLSNISLPTINLDQSDTDIEQQPQATPSPTVAESDADGRIVNIETATSPSPVMPGEGEVEEVQVMPEVEAVLAVENSNYDDESQDEELQPSVMVAMASVSKPKQRTVKRKRDAPITNMEPYTVKEFNQSLLSLLECPVCLEWMEPPLSQCRRGHLVCSRCRTRLYACPVCRTAFSSVRNRAMEAVAEMLRYPCRHGCGREKRLRRRPAHEASCSARRYRCPAPQCAGCAPLPLEELCTHLQSKHPTIVKNGKKHKFSMKMNSEQHDMWLILVEHELFHLCIDVDIRTWGVVVYVAYIGPKRNASNFTYEVTVTAQHNERKLIYSRVTHSDLESSSLNVSRQDCFHLTLDQALNFLKLKNKHSQPDKFLDFYVEISKRDRFEPSKDDSDTS